MGSWGELVTFNPTIDLGSLLTIIAWLVGLGALISSVRGNAKDLGRRVASLEEKFDHHATKLEIIAVQNNRLDRIEKDIHDLRRGEGFVLPLSRSAREIGGE